jgi:hypothetical protein
MLMPIHPFDAIQILTMLVLSLIVTLHLAFVLFMGGISFPREKRNKALYLDHLQRPSIVLWLTAHVRFFGSDLFILSWAII